MPSHPHLIILPYFCEEEVVRYLKIAERLKTFPVPKRGYCFLLASSPRVETSQALIDAFSQLGTTIPFACPTPVFGYPAGPTVMFWDCMEYISREFPAHDGFCLWLESDMAPVQPDWIDRLSEQWYEGPERPIMMGCYVPEVYKHRFFKKPKLILHPHINGGACYATDFVRHMPDEARHGVFDMAVFEYAQKLGRARTTRHIAFSTLGRVRRDLLDDSKVLLHGFMQPKDAFIDACLTPLSEREKSARSWNPFWDSLETLRRKIRVCIFRKGNRAMLENMFLAKQKYEREEDLARQESQTSHPVLS